MSDTEQQFVRLRRIRLLTGLFILGLFISGLTALPLQQELDWLAGVTGASSFQGQEFPPSSPVTVWLAKVRAALDDVEGSHPFLFYGTDWLAFGHFVIALAFVGAWRDPVRNRWLFDFGLIACVAVIPYAFVFGGLRGIPIWWRLIDCSFGVVGFVPLWFCRKWAIEAV